MTNFEAMNDPKADLTILDELLELAVEKHGPKNIEAANLLCLQGTLYGQVGNYARSSALHRRAIEALPQLPIEGARGACEYYGTAAMAEMAAGDYACAHKFAQHQLELAKGCPQPDFEELARSHMQLGIVEMHREEYVVARDHLDEARSWLKQIPPPNDWLRFQVPFSQALLELTTGRYAEALDKSREAVQSTDKSATKAYGLIAMARSQTALAQYNDASHSIELASEEIANKSEQTRLRMHVEINRAKAEVLMHTGQFDTAKRLLSDVIAATYDPSKSQWMSTPVVQLGHALIGVQDFAAAHRHFDQGLKAHVQRYGVEHSETAEVLDGLGQVSAAIGKSDEALTYFERALSIRRAKLGDDHPKTAVSLEHLGRFLASRDNLDAACLHMSEAHSICVERLGNEHPQTLRVGEQLAVIRASAVNLGDQAAQPSSRQEQR